MSTFFLVSFAFISIQPTIQLIFYSNVHGFVRSMVGKSDSEENKLSVKSFSSPKDSVSDAFDSFIVIGALFMNDDNDNDYDDDDDDNKRM